MPRPKNIDALLDEFLSTAPKDRLLRLQGDLNAVLRWKFQEQPPAPAKRGRKPKESATTSASTQRDLGITEVLS